MTFPFEKKPAALQRKRIATVPKLESKTGRAIVVSPQYRIGFGLAEIEAALRRAATSGTSSPFLADVPLSDTDRNLFLNAARATPPAALFSRFPTLGVWATLLPLVRTYGVKTADVYIHISEGLGRDLEEQRAREPFKVLYRKAARAIGLPVSGNEPTGLFFAPLGPVESQHAWLADAFVGMALDAGPPATEDTLAARRWQRMAVASRATMRTRLKAAIDFDQSAFVAGRFGAWRRGEAPSTEVEAHLFAAYDRATRGFGRQRTDIVGPPSLIWAGDRLGFEAEATRLPQTLKLGPFPTPVASGSRVVLSEPWPAAVRWTCGAQASDLPAAPRDEEILAFEMATGALLARLGPDDDRLECTSPHVVLLSRLTFRSMSFGDALPSRDGTVNIAWLDLGDEVIFDTRKPLRIVAPSEPSLGLDAPVLGRDGSRPLYACDGQLVLRINPEIGGRGRILRARLGEVTRYIGLDLPTSGEMRIPLFDLGFDAASEPGSANFEILAPGAFRNSDARAELALSAWIWPGLTVEAARGDWLPLPGNFVAARSQGVVELDGQLHIQHDTEAQILGLGARHLAPGTVREFQLAARGERLWQNRAETKDRVLVPHGARIVLGEANRHDSLQLKSDDRDADLLVLGKRIRRPFYARTFFDIGASRLELVGDDDRIAFLRKDGRVDLLARVSRREDPSGISVRRVGTRTTLRFVPQQSEDALRLVVETSDGRTIAGETGFTRTPVGRPLPVGARASYDPETRAIEIELEDSLAGAPSLAQIFLRHTGRHDFVPVEDARGAALAVPLGGPLPNPDQGALARLAEFMSMPRPEAVQGLFDEVLAPSYQAAFQVVGAAHFVAPVRQALTLVRPDGGPPLHDLAGVAPWIFEAGPHAFSGINPATFLAPLSRMAAIPRPASLPDIRGDRPLLAWLDLLQTAESGTIPAELSSERLAHGFLSLRYHLRETGLSILSQDTVDATALRIICEPHVEDLDRLRLFDFQGGGDPSAARIVALLERFARAAALKEAGPFLDGIALRTGLPATTCGRLLTLAIRAGAECFAYFRILWHHAASDAALTSP